MENFIEYFVYSLMVLVLYFLPAAIAVVRGHKNANPIAIINLVTGWTILGWFGCLAWAFSDNIKSSSDNAYKGKLTDRIKEESLKSDKKDVENSSVIECLEKLASLKEKNIITDEEFESQKKKILEKD